MNFRKIVNYFNLDKSIPNEEFNDGLIGKSGDSVASPPPSPQKEHWFKQFLMYLGVLLGVIFSSAIKKFAEGITTELSFSWSYLAISAVAALLIIPYVYDKLKIHKDAPFIVRFGFFVQNGVFWEVIISGIGKALK